MQQLFIDVPETLEDLRYHIARLGFINEDRFRVAIKGDYESEKEYNEIRKKGCCGFFDASTKINGITYLIGCNYGH